MQYTINKLKDVDSLLFKKLKDFCFDVNGCLHDVHAEHRQQLWNDMRLTKTRIGILNNFAPVHDQCEHYYLDTEKDIM